MTIDTTSYYDSLLLSSTTDTTVEYTTSEEATSLTSEDFLTLLVTELEYQDPTDPLDNAEMVSQLTSYSQLDELSEMNEKMDTLTDTLNSITATNGLDYLGKEVEASGYSVAVDGDDVSTLYFELDEAAESVNFNVYNSDGTIVDTQTYSNLSAGSHTFSWDGTDYDGDAASDGTYYVLATATDSDGSSVDVSTTTTGTVTGINTTDDGIVLTLEDGRTVNLLDVTYATS